MACLNKRLVGRNMRQDTYGAKEREKAVVCLVAAKPRAMTIMIHGLGLMHRTL